MATGGNGKTNGVDPSREPERDEPVATEGHRTEEPDPGVKADKVEDAALTGEPDRDIRDPLDAAAAISEAEKAEDERPAASRDPADVPPDGAPILGARAGGAGEERWQGWLPSFRRGADPDSASRSIMAGLGAVAALALIAAIWGWSRAATLENDLAEARAAEQQVEQRLASLSGERDTARQELQALASRVGERDRLEQQLVTLVPEAERLRGEIAALQDQQAQLRDEVAQLQAAAAAIFAERDAALGQVEEARLQETEAVRRAAEATELLSTRNAELAGMTERAEQISRQIAADEQRLSDIQGQLADGMQALSAGQEQLTAIQTYLEQAAQVQQDQSAQLRQQLDQLGQLAAQIQSARQGLVVDDAAEGPEAGTSAGEPAATPSPVQDGQASPPQ